MRRTRAQQLWLGAGTGSEPKATDVKIPYAVGATLVVMCYICYLCNAAAAITAVRTVDFSIIASITARTAQLKGIADSTNSLNISMLHCPSRSIERKRHSFLCAGRTLNWQRCSSRPSSRPARAPRVAGRSIFPHELIEKTVCKQSNARSKLRCMRVRSSATDLLRQALYQLQFLRQSESKNESVHCQDSIAHQ